MKKNIIILTLIAIAAFTFAGCTTKKNFNTNSKEPNTDGTSNNSNDEPPTKEPEAEVIAPILERIDAAQAKEMMDDSNSLIILDVRTVEEFNEGYIKGAVLIPDYEIKAKSEATLEDKSATILVYCRSGRRSALAAQALSELGYTTVYDFGGILDWPYDIVVD